MRKVEAILLVCCLQQKYKARQGILATVLKWCAYVFPCGHFFYRSCGLFQIAICVSLDLPIVF
jgi:hypothetical protein